MLAHQSFDGAVTSAACRRKPLPRSVWECDEIIRTPSLPRFAVAQSTGVARPEISTLNLRTIRTSRQCVPEPMFLLCSSALYGLPTPEPSMSHYERPQLDPGLGERLATTVRAASDADAVAVRRAIHRSIRYDAVSGGVNAGWERWRPRRLPPEVRTTRQSTLDNTPDRISAIDQSYRGCEHGCSMLRAAAHASSATHRASLRTRSTQGHAPELLGQGTGPAHYLPRPCARAVTALHRSSSSAHHATRLEVLEPPRTRSGSSPHRRAPSRIDILARRRTPGWSRSPFDHSLAGILHELSPRGDTITAYRASGGCPRRHSRLRHVAPIFPALTTARSSHP